MKIKFKNFSSTIAIIIVRLYQIFISPLFNSCCRFSPSCSQYAIEAIKKCGLLFGIYLTIIRILKCNPMGKYGYDPVEKKSIEFKNILGYFKSKIT